MRFLRVLFNKIMKSRQKAMTSSVLMYSTQKLIKSTKKGLIRCALYHCRTFCASCRIYSAIFENDQHSLAHVHTSILLTSFFSFSTTECPTLPTSISHGVVYGSGNLEGSSFRFICQDGYSLVGSDVLFCSQEGSWNTSVPKCLRGKNKNLFS